MATKRAYTPDPKDSLTPAKARKCAYDEETMKHMARTGDLCGIRKAIDDLGYIPHRGTVQREAAFHGRLSILHFIYAQYVEGTGGSTYFRDDNEMDAAVRGGHEETIRWMCRHYHDLFCLVKADDDDDDRENNNVGLNDLGRAYRSPQEWLVDAGLWSLSRWAYGELGLEYDERSVMCIISRNNPAMLQFAVECGAKVNDTELLDCFGHNYSDAGTRV
ncbi:hypothetical protein pneo_cds_610 [Pandoravirus neocaledonia]|uniref:Ankyrin repeat domain containing protein n=1 Tax=Pandoravirus neocaledonia TaxID=2107708 RepID=A0A2U7UCS0_9VIRU|nr:hypothetical protein pneo_cds_610 [Pandoravirus neocaledonia]AVK76217.1 hypothetical protein pneo_cds_610 [Pandoravirus neocaledonia]